MDIKQELMTYISCKEANGALLVTGKWGCGKTYTIRQVAEELNRGDNFHVVVISLFGIETILELNKKVKEHVFNATSDSLKIIKQFTSYFKSATDKIKEYSKIAKGVNTVLSIDLYDFLAVENEISCYQNGSMVKKKVVLIFDDFERSTIGRIELLGAINDYNENKSIKTVLVADETRIKEAEYREFKEKLISRTVKLTSNYKSIIASIIGTYKETKLGYKEFLTQHINYTTQVFLESQAENIRTFKSYIIDFERVYDAWKNSDVPIDNMGNVLYAFGAILFEHKANNYEKTPDDKYIFNYKNLSEKYTQLGSNLYCLNTLERWITNGEWDEKDFKNEIDSKFSNKSMTDEQRFLEYDFWDLEQDYITNGLPIVIKRAYAGELNCRELESLLHKEHLLKKFEVPLPCDINYAAIMAGLDIREKQIIQGLITEPINRTYIQNDEVLEMDPEAQHLYHRLENMNATINALQNRSDFISFIKNESSISRYDLKYHSIISFDSELLNLFFEQFQKHKNSMRREMAMLLKDISFDNPEVSEKRDMEETLSNFKKLIVMLENLQKSQQGNISKIFTEAVINLFPEMIQKLEKKVETYHNHQDSPN